MTSGVADPPESEDVHRPRTFTPGLGDEEHPVVRPRTIPALGRPDPIPMPPQESFFDPAPEPEAGLWFDDDDLWIREPP
ncbi:MAG: hypothetical protein JWM47_3369, partial [Acidimicrobiales bacterium]|nr:hypothetical protein [Acidimicrobiales bacterium]